MCNPSAASSAGEGSMVRIVDRGLSILVESETAGDGYIGVLMGTGQ